MFDGTFHWSVRWHVRRSVRWHVRWNVRWSVRWHVRRNVLCQTDGVDVAELAETPANGRQIKNAIRLAKALGESAGSGCTTADFSKAILAQDFKRAAVTDVTKAYTLRAVDAARAVAA